MSDIFAEITHAENIAAISFEMSAKVRAEISQLRADASKREAHVNRLESENAYLRDQLRGALEQLAASIQSEKGTIQTCAKLQFLADANTESARKYRDEVINLRRLLLAVYPHLEPDDVPGELLSEIEDNMEVLE